MVINPEIRNRIRLSVAAYAYEFESDLIMTDQEFDDLAKSINSSVETGNNLLDEFFRTEFVSFSGVWVHSHPEIEKLRNLYHRYYKSSGDDYDLKNNTDLFGPILIERKYHD